MKIKRSAFWFRFYWAFNRRSPKNSCQYIIHNTIRATGLLVTCSPFLFFFYCIFSYLGWIILSSFGYDVPALLGFEAHLEKLFVGPFTTVIPPIVIAYFELVFLLKILELASRKLYKWQEKHFDKIEIED